MILFLTSWYMLPRPGMSQDYRMWNTSRIALPLRSHRESHTMIRVRDSDYDVKGTSDPQEHSSRLNPSMSQSEDNSSHLLRIGQSM